jgi:hypothetical protein
MDPRLVRLAGNVVDGDRVVPVGHGQRGGLAEAVGEALQRRPGGLAQLRLDLRAQLEQRGAQHVLAVGVAANEAATVQRLEEALHRLALQAETPAEGAGGARAVTGDGAEQRQRQLDRPGIVGHATISTPPCGVRCLRPVDWTLGVHAHLVNGLPRFVPYVPSRPGMATRSALSWSRVGTPHSARSRSSSSR